MAVTPFTVIESIHGKFIINRHCAYQAETLIKTGATHIESELKNLLAVASTLPPQAVAVDAGANAGLVAVPLANLIKAKGGQVHAFEVQRPMYYALCGTVALNDLSDTLHIHNQGLGDTAKTLKVPLQDYGKPKDFGMVSLVNQEAIAQFEEVQIVTLDSLKLPRLDFLKIDVEGMEIEVLQGGAKTLRQYRPWCWIEYWMVDKDKLKAQFAGLDYTLYTMDKLNILCAPNEKLGPGKINIEAPAF